MQTSSSRVISVSADFITLKLGQRTCGSHIFDIVYKTSMFELKFCNHSSTFLSFTSQRQEASCYHQSGEVQPDFRLILIFGVIAVSNVAKPQEHL